MVTDMSRARSAAVLTAVDGARPTAPVVRRLSPVAARCRPQETPVWVRLELSSAEGWQLREQAIAAGVPLDAWLAVMVEFTWTLRTLARAGSSPAHTRARLERDVRKGPLRLAASSNWRAWQATLAGAGAPAPDELPEVVLPRRLLAAARDGAVLRGALAAAGDWVLARACELHASGAGESLEDLMRHGAHSAGCSGSTGAAQPSGGVEDALGEHERQRLPSELEVT
jgi:hypothetical protein